MVPIGENRMNQEKLFKEKIDSRAVLYSLGANDECYTPAYGVTPVLKFIPGGVPPAGDVTRSAPMGRRSFLLCRLPLQVEP